MIKSPPSYEIYEIERMSLFGGITIAFKHTNLVEENEFNYK